MDLAPLPDDFEATRLALHRVAEHVVAPARKPDNEISLIATPGGFGTPRFEWEGAEHQVRVEGTELVRSSGRDESRVALTSLADARTLVADLLPWPDGLDAEPLEIEAEAAHALGAWYELGDAALERLRAEVGPEDDPSPVSLWPEHFDIAIESGSEPHGLRANYGFSPGDEHHPEPYLYVGPWRGDVSGELWNGNGFSGAELGYDELRRAPDQLEAALQFCRDRREALESIQRRT